MDIQKLPLSGLKLDPGLTLNHMPLYTLIYVPIYY